MTPRLRAPAHEAKRATFLGVQIVARAIGDRGPHALPSNAEKVGP
jgi:hypothetical protein